MSSVHAPNDTAEHVQAEKDLFTTASHGRKNCAVCSQDLNNNDTRLIDDIEVHAECASEE